MRIEEMRKRYNVTLVGPNHNIVYLYIKNIKKINEKKL